LEIYFAFVSVDLRYVEQVPLVQVSPAAALQAWGTCWHLRRRTAGEQHYAVCALSVGIMYFASRHAIM
jgi:hypothetical protein